MSGTSDPYVKVTLLPDKKHRLETKIKRRTLNPRWNETFYFEGFPVQKLQSRILHLHVFDYDRFSRDDSIGEVFLPLCSVDITGKPSFWKSLKPPAKDKCGELLCSLCYHPSNSILTLSLVKAKNLKAKDINGKSGKYFLNRRFHENQKNNMILLLLTDPYVKVNILKTGFSHRC